MFLPLSLSVSVRCSSFWHCEWEYFVKMLPYPGWSVVISLLWSVGLLVSNCCCCWCHCLAAERLPPSIVAAELSRARSRSVPLLLGLTQRQWTCDLAWASDPQGHCTRQTSWPVSALIGVKLSDLCHLNAHGSVSLDLGLAPSLFTCPLCPQMMAAVSYFKSTFLFAATPLAQITEGMTCFFFSPPVVFLFR